MSNLDITLLYSTIGCQKSDGTCVDVGKQFEENCSVYECVEGDNTLGREVVSQGEWQQFTIKANKESKGKNATAIERNERLLKK